jgi:hypothetical protein
MIDDAPDELLDDELDELPLDDAPDELLLDDAPDELLLDDELDELLEPHEQRQASEKAAMTTIRVMIGGRACRVPWRALPESARWAPAGA